MEPERTIGRYRVLSALGTGGMGEVLRARDERLGRDVAIKRVRNVTGAVKREFLARFESEARALAALAHPGVVQVFDLGVDDDDPYLVMELIEGPNLRKILDDSGALAPAAARSLGIQLARALEAAHARGIVHRDIKPANVLQGPGGLWKLADFGVARVPDSTMTATGIFMGTPAYGAPESLTHALFGPASDMFSLAVTLAEALTGKNPRRDLKPIELVARAREPVATDGIPADLAAALAPALAFDPSKRPSAAMFAEWLAGGHAPTAARVVSAPVAAASAKASDTVIVADATVGTAGTAGTAGTVGTVGTVAVPDETVDLRARVVVAPPRSRRTVMYVIAGVLGIGLVAAIASTCSGGSHGAKPPPRETDHEARDEPADEPADEADLAQPPLDDQPRRFRPPPDLDDRSEYEWHGVAQAVNAGDFGGALRRIRNFEAHHGESVETTALREWLESRLAAPQRDDEE